MAPVVLKLAGVHADVLQEKDILCSAGFGYHDDGADTTDGNGLAEGAWL